MNSISNIRPYMQASDGMWKDKKYYAWLISPSIPLIIMGMTALYHKNPSKYKILSWAGPIVLYGVFPALDMFIGEDKENPPEWAIRELEQNPYYNHLVKAFIPAQMALNLYTAYLYKHKAQTWVEKIGLTGTAGITNMIGVNAAHEMSHKRGRTKRLLGLIATAPTGLGHFMVEHPFGHHKRVATPEDPATSAMGESFWRFMPKSIIGSFKSGLAIEYKRLARQGKSFWHVENEILQGAVMTAGYMVMMTKMFGREIIPFLFMKAVYGMHFLEVANYVEHYGLLRQKNEDGTYKRTEPEHSWNSNTLLSNLATFQLQRHSDHHAYPTRSYQSLRHFDNTPQLPAGYGVMFWLAYITPLWYKVMDQRVVNHYKGDVRKANIHPSARERILKQFAKK